MWCTKSGMIFQETRLVNHGAWAWTSDSKIQLLIVITCLIKQTVLSSFPSCLSSPLFTSISGQHILNEAFALQFLLKISLWRIQTKTLVCTVIFSFHPPPWFQFWSPPPPPQKKQNTSQRVASMALSRLSQSWKDRLCMINYFCRVGIFCGYQPHFMIFSCLIAWRTLAWKVLVFHLIFIWGIFVYYRKVLSHSPTSTTSRQKTFYIRIKVRHSSIIFNTEAWKFK